MQWLNLQWRVALKQEPKCPKPRFISSAHYDIPSYHGPLGIQKKKRGSWLDESKLVHSFAFHLYQVVIFSPMLLYAICLSIQRTECKKLRPLYQNPVMVLVNFMSFSVTFFGSGIEDWFKRGHILIYCSCQQDLHGIVSLSVWGIPSILSCTARPALSCVMRSNDPTRNWNIAKITCRLQVAWGWPNGKVPCVVTTTLAWSWRFAYGWLVTLHASSRTCFDSLFWWPSEARFKLTVDGWSSPLSVSCPKQNW